MSLEEAKQVAGDDPILIEMVEELIRLLERREAGSASRRATLLVRLRVQYQADWSMDQTISSGNQEWTLSPTLMASPLLKGLCLFFIG